MRRATHDTQWLFDKDGHLQGIALGFDFASEHEWGIDRLKQAFGISTTKTPIGINDRKITIVPEHLVYMEFDHKPNDKRKKAEHYAALAYMNMSYYQNAPERLKEIVLRNAEPYSYDEKCKPIGAAWSEQDFGIVVKGDENITRLRELYDAFKIKDIAVAPGKSRGFLRSFGLTFVIISRLEPEVFEAVLAADKDHDALLKAAEATGIVKRLNAAKKEFFACSPAWANKDKKEVHFWLNPEQQDENNYGWYTVKDLDDWIAGKGKIPMTAEQKRERRRR